MGWTHFKAIIPMADPLKPDFYAEIFGIEQWSTPTMRNYRRCKVMNYMQSRVADTYAHGLTNSTGAKRA